MSVGLLALLSAMLVPFVVGGFVTSRGLQRELAALVSWMQLALFRVLTFESRFQINAASSYGTASSLAEAVPVDASVVIHGSLYGSLAGTCAVASAVAIVVQNKLIVVAQAATKHYVIPAFDVHLLTKRLRL